MNTVVYIGGAITVAVLLIVICAQCCPRVYSVPNNSSIQCIDIDDFNKVTMGGVYLGMSSQEVVALKGLPVVESGAWNYPDISLLLQDDKVVFILEQKAIVEPFGIEASMEIDDVVKRLGVSGYGEKKGDHFFRWCKRVNLEYKQFNLRCGEDGKVYSLVLLSFPACVSKSEINLGGIEVDMSKEELLHLMGDPLEIQLGIASLQMAHEGIRPEVINEKFERYIYNNMIVVLHKYTNKVVFVQTKDAGVYTSKGVHVGISKPDLMGIYGNTGYEENQKRYTLRCCGSCSPMYKQSIEIEFDAKNEVVEIGVGVVDVTRYLISVFHVGGQRNQ